MAVICAGVKSILDIGRTLEYLETQGVPVITLGQKKTFPAFFTPESDYEAPYQVGSAVEAARVISECTDSNSDLCVVRNWCPVLLSESSLEFGVGSGIVLAVPPSSFSPSDGTSCSGQEIEDAIQTALKEARWVTSKGLAT